MATPADPTKITARTLLRASEVCQLADLKPYVLRSWESEFPSLGVARSPGGPRMYRKRDVERVLLIKRLVFVEGLTLAGVRRRLDEPEATEDAEVPDLGEVLGAEARDQVSQVKRGLESLLEMLSAAPADAAAPPRRGGRSSKAGGTRQGGAAKTARRPGGKSPTRKRRRAAERSAD
jgi:DNA-binding transcriptional MerR regulator